MIFPPRKLKKYTSEEMRERFGHANGSGSQTPSNDDDDNKDGDDDDANDHFKGGGAVGRILRAFGIDEGCKQSSSSSGSSGGAAPAFERPEYVYVTPKKKPKSH